MDCGRGGGGVVEKDGRLWEVRWERRDRLWEKDGRGVLHCGRVAKRGVFLYCKREPRSEITNPTLQYGRWERHLSRGR